MSEYRVQFLKVYLLLVVCLFTTSSLAADKIEFKITHVQINEQSYKLELAKTYEERQLGLMFRTSLQDYFGMLFIYPKPGYHRIWMKNTLIPLTVIWLDVNEVVIGIKKLQPCVAGSCPSYGFNKHSSYVIELNSSNNDFSIGDSIPGLQSLR